MDDFQRLAKVAKVDLSGEYYAPSDTALQDVLARNFGLSVATFSFYPSLYDILQNHVVAARRGNAVEMVSNTTTTRSANSIGDLKVLGKLGRRYVINGLLMNDDQITDLREYADAMAEDIECEGWKPTMKLCKRGYCSAKEKYQVYPSAYANAYASKVCQGLAPDSNGVTAADPKYMERLGLLQAEPEGMSALQRWFKEEWVNVCEKDDKGNYKPCGRQAATRKAEDYPYCRPLHRVDKNTPRTVGELSEQELTQMCERKRATDPGQGSTPTRVFVKDLPSDDGSFQQSARVKIEQLIATAPSSWKKLFQQLGLSTNPSIEDIIDAALAKTAGGNDAGPKGEEVGNIPLEVRKDALKGVELSHKANYPSYNGIGLARGMQLATQDFIWKRSMQRMCAFFRRNKRYLAYECFGETETPCKSYMAWLNWGGTPGRDWSCQN